MSTQVPTTGPTEPSRAGGGATRVRLEVGGRMTGDVLVRRQGSLVLMHFTVAHGHLPPATRRELVERAFQLPEFARACQQVLAIIPLGDVELLRGLQTHLDGVRARAAGATCLVDATTR